MGVIAPAPLVAAAAIALVAASCTGASGPGGGSPNPAGASPSGRDARADAEPTIDPREIRFSTHGWRTDFSKRSVDMREIVSGGPGKDGIPAIDDPRFDSIEAAREWLSERAAVMSVVDGEVAKAYPIAILIWHEIVNDTVGSVPVLVTYCPLCNTALALDPVIDGVVHDFGTTGNLRFSDLVMYDRQTESWWQQATGEAIVGELTGRRLDFVPAQMISLDDFARAHPDGVVLSRATGYARPYGENPYVGYDDPEGEPYLLGGDPDRRLPPMERVVTVGESSDGIAFPYSELAKVGSVHETVAGQPIVVFWVPGTDSPLDTRFTGGQDIGATGVFRPFADGRPLAFGRSGGEDAPITDRETGSTWSVTGLALSGPLAGTRLEPIVHGDHFWFAWAAFVPETRIWRAP